MSAHDKDEQADQPTTQSVSIVDLIIQEQMEKNALVLAPRPDVQTENEEPASTEQTELEEDSSPSEQESDEEDDWELTPEELAELAELEAEMAAEETIAEEANTEEAKEPSPAVTEIVLEPEEAAVDPISPEEPVLEQVADSSEVILRLVRQPSSVPEPDSPSVQVSAPEVQEPDPEVQEPAPELEEPEPELQGPAPELEGPPPELLGPAPLTLLEPASEAQEPVLCGAADINVDELLAEAAILEEASLEVMLKPESEPEDLPEDKPETHPVKKDEEWIDLVSGAQAPVLASVEIAPSQENKRVFGGNLRQLESSLTKTLEEDVPKSIRDRAVPTLRLLSSLKNIQRAMLVIFHGGEIKCLASGGMVEGKRSLEQSPLRVLRSVLRSKEDLLILDAEKDPRFSTNQDVQALGIKSLICVPFQDCRSGLDGLLYADHLQETNAFTHQDLATVRGFAERLATDYQFGVTVNPNASNAPPKRLTETTKTDPRWYLAAAAALICLAYPALSNPAKKEEKPKPIPVVERVTTEPETVVLSFIRAVETRNINSAYKYFSAQRRSKLEREDFGKKVRRFLAEDDNAWALSRLSIVKENRRFGKDKHFRLVRADKKKNSWKIVVTDDGQGSWYVSQLIGMKQLSLD